MTARLVSAVLAAGLVTGACHGGLPSMPFPTNDGGANPDAGSAFDAGSGGLDAGLPMAQACTVLNAKRCEALERCGLLPSDGGLATCLGFYEATWCGPTTWVSRVSPPVNTLRYDAERALACANAYDTRACGQVTVEPEACSRFLSPNAQLRQPCYDGYLECVEGVCRGISCGDRRCRPRGQAGEDCRVTSDCMTGLLCRPVTASPGLGVCSRPLVEGEVCIGAAECGPGLTCIGQCVAEVGLGASCVTSRCNAQTYCGSPGDAGVVCLARLNSGSACTADAQCSAGLVCDVFSRRCEPTLVTQSGGACGPQQTCALDSVCLGLTSQMAGQCKPPLVSGASCSRSEECEAHLRCTSTDGGVCAARGQAGETCASARDCAHFFACLQGHCIQRPTLGASCSTALRCVWGACAGADGDGGLLCTQAGGPGARCDEDAACASQRCMQSKCVAACVP